MQEHLLGFVPHALFPLLAQPDRFDSSPSSSSETRDFQFLLFLLNHASLPLPLSLSISLSPCLPVLRLCLRLAITTGSILFLELCLWKYSDSQACRRQQMSLTHQKIPISGVTKMGTTKTIGLSIRTISFGTTCWTRTMTMMMTGGGNMASICMKMNGGIKSNSPSLHFRRCVHACARACMRECGAFVNVCSICDFWKKMCIITGMC